MGGNGIAQWLQFGAFWRGKAELLAQLKVTARKLLSNLMEYENVMFKSVLPTCFLSNGIVIKNRDQRRKQVILSLTIILSPAITDAVTHTPICHPGQKQSLKHLEWLTLITAPLHPASPPTGTQVPSAHHQHEWVRRLCFLPGNMSQVSGTAAVAYWNWTEGTSKVCGKQPHAAQTPQWISFNTQTILHAAIALYRTITHQRSISVKAVDKKQRKWLSWKQVQHTGPAAHWMSEMYKLVHWGLLKTENSHWKHWTAWFELYRNPSEENTGDASSRYILKPEIITSCPFAGHHPVQKSTRSWREELNE